MRYRLPRIYVESIGWIVGLTLSAICLLGAWSYREEVAEQWPLLLGLTLAAISAARLAPSSARATPRFTMTFVLAGLLLLPAPAAALVGLAASVGAGGSSVTGRHHAGIRAYAAFAGALVVAAWIAPAVLLPAAPSELDVRLLVTLGVAIPLGTTILQWMFGDSRAPSRREIRALLLEALNLPLGGLIAGLVLIGQWPSAAVCALLTLLAGAAFRRWSGLSSDLRRSRALLAQRHTELDTLHAIGREIVSSLEPLRVCAVIERECRKIFEVDSFIVALADPDASRLNLTYRRELGAIAATEQVDLPREFASWMLEHKTAVRIDDLPLVDRRDAHLDGVLDEGMRSALLVPLIVGDRLIGVLSIQSERRRAYDDHQLSVLTTIGQQAAVAFENARHHQLATVDSLTGFFVRDHFFIRLDEEYRRARRYGGVFSLLMLDLDGFKDINDRYGHLAGDGYLRGISATILSGLRAADLAARYGGDEFCLLLPETDLQGARAIAERIREAIAVRSVAFDGVALRTTASIGVATFPEHDGGAARALIRSADEALYRAKRAGRDRVVPYAA